MSFPTDYLADAGSDQDEGRKQEEVWEYLDARKLVATRREDRLPGCVSRVRIDVFGRTAAEVESTLLQFGGRCDSASEAHGCAYGECVIERNLQEEWGDYYSWKGRLVLHPNIGEMTASERAKEALSSDG